MEDIKVDTFNFMATDNDDCQSAYDDEDDFDDIQEEADIGKSPISSEVQTQNSSSNKKPLANSFEFFGEESEKVKHEPQKLLKFEVGKIRFYISKIELDMLNNAYTKYLDTVYPAKSFIDYILEGCK